MPMNPAAPESVAPIKKPTAGCQPSGAGSSAMTIARKTATIATVTYCKRKKAIAPSWIARAISIIRGFPSGCRRTQAVKAKP